MLNAITRSAQISFNGRILQVELFDDLHIEVEDVEENYKIALDLIKDQFYLSLVIAAPNTNITREAREAGNQAEKYKNCVAQAIVVSSLSTRIIGNFMIRFLKNHCPQKLFQSTEDAVNWLNEQWKLAESLKFEQVSK